MKVKIKGENYNIKLVSKIDSDDVNRVVGQCKKVDKKILLTKDDDMRYTAETIIHELMHAFLYECGLVKESSDEEMVDWFERQFIDIFDTFVKVFEYMYPEKHGELIKLREVIK